MTLPARKNDDPPISREDFAYLQDFMYKRAGIVLSDNKAYLAETRLSALVERHHLGTLGDLVSRLRMSPRGPISDEIVDAFTTNETSFFRDSHPFELLTRSLLPELIQARASRRRLRIWSAASSTGQEAYSLGILIHTHFPELASWDVQILGTDICSEALTTAREGLYRSLHLNRGLSPAQRSRFFTQEGRRFRISQSLRDMTTFKPLNLCFDAYPRQQFDIVMLRNVLIYFDNATQQSVLTKLHPCLASDGALFLGGTEAALKPPEHLYMPNINGRTIYHSPKPGSKR